MDAELYETSPVNENKLYETSPVKRIRRTNAELDTILQASQQIIAEENGQVTIRHLFYRLVGEGLIKKTEKEYKNLCIQLMNWRRSRDISWGVFADNTRWRYGSRGNSSMETALRNAVENYRKNLWLEQPIFIEIWCEKDAIASILLDEAQQYGIQVFPLRGFVSATALYSVAENFKYQMEAGKDVYVYYFGDHDPSGTEIDKSAVRNLKNDHNVEVNFERVAVLPEHIEEYDLLTRPSKKSDPRAANFEGESVEIDAMPMVVLRTMVQNCITQHINPQEWASELATEEMERATTNMFLDKLYGPRS